MDKVIFNNKYDKGKWALLLDTQKDIDMLKNSNYSNLWHSRVIEGSYLRIKEGGWDGWNSNRDPLIRNFKDYKQILVSKMVDNEEVW